MTQSGYLLHYGVKGMKWGVWNAETSARYNGSKSTKRSTISIGKGHEFSRITSAKSARTARIRRRRYEAGRGVYVSDNPYDFTKYVNEAEWLPSVMKDNPPGRKRNPKVGVVTYKASKDLKIASAIEVGDYVVKTYGNMKVKDLLAETRKKAPYKKDYTDRIEKTLTSKQLNSSARSVIRRSYTNVDVKSRRNVYDPTRYLYTGTKAQQKGKHVYNMLSSMKVGSFSNPKAQQAMRDYFQKKHYDGQIDPEDYGSGLAERPMIVYDPASNLKVSSAKVQRLKKLRSNI